MTDFLDMLDRLPADLMRHNNCQRIRSVRTEVQ